MNNPSLINTEDIPVQVNDGSVIASAVAWGGYRNAGLISESDGEMLQKFDGKSFDEMLKLFDEKPDEHAVMLLRVIDSVNKEEAVRFLLAAISLFFKAGRTRVFLECKSKKLALPWGPLEKLLKRPSSDFYLLSTAATLYSRMIEIGAVLKLPIADENVTIIINFAVEQLRKNDVDSQRVGALALRPLLSIEAYRLRLAEDNNYQTVEMICNLIKAQSNRIQLVYELAYLLWQLTFSNDVVISMPPIVVRTLVECVKAQKKEKIIRITVAALASLCSTVKLRALSMKISKREAAAAAALAAQAHEGHAAPAPASNASAAGGSGVPEHDDVIDDAATLSAIELESEGRRFAALKHAESALDAGLPKPIAVLRARRWADEELANDLDILNFTMQRSVRELSSMEKYKNEVLSGQLEWSPPHKSDRFWHENIDEFIEEDCRLIKALKVLAQNPNPKISAIACYDLGEFARIHPKGKSILDETGVKALLLTLMSSSKNAEVQKEALFATQKLMVAKFEKLVS